MGKKKGAKGAKKAGKSKANNRGGNKSKGSNAKQKKNGPKPAKAAPQNKKSLKNLKAAPPKPTAKRDAPKINFAPPKDAVNVCQTLQKQHTKPIQGQAFAMNKLMTAGQDGFLKSYDPGAGPSLTPVATPPVKLPSTPWCMTKIDDWVLIGLQSGDIQGYRTDGATALLCGHSLKCEAISSAGGLVLTGGHDGQLKVWRPDAATATFNCEATVQVKEKILSLKAAAHFVFAGTEKGLYCIDTTVVPLVAKRIPLHAPDGKKPVNPRITALVTYGEFLIAACSDGYLRVLNSQAQTTGICQLSSNTPVRCMDGVVTQSGKAKLLVGHVDSSFALVVLDAGFRVEEAWKSAKLTGGITSVNYLGMDGLLVATAVNGSLELWQFV